jgi:hypothetical protein
MDSGIVVGAAKSKAMPSLLPRLLLMLPVTKKSSLWQPGVLLAIGAHSQMPDWPWASFSQEPAAMVPGLSRAREVESLVTPLVSHSG